MPHDEAGDHHRYRSITASSTGDAKDPSSGAAANAGLGYARSAIGKADVVERLPVVVGYAQDGGTWKAAAPSAPAKAIEGGGDPPPAAVDQARTARFGWILGPRVNTVDPKRGKLELQQGQKTYDLSADISVSGWRTRLPLEVRTAWSPDWRSRQFVGAMDQASPKHVEWIQLNPSASEFSALTQQLGFGGAGQGIRSAVIDRFRPAQVKACAAATLVLHGDNLWRATDIVIGGRRLGGDAIAVLPDMRGITVDIPAKTSFADISGQKVEIQVLTPYGVAEAHDPLVVETIQFFAGDKSAGAKAIRLVSRNCGGKS